MSSNIAPPIAPPFRRRPVPPSERRGHGGEVRLMRRWLPTASRNYG